MRKYELVVIFSPETPSEKQKKLVSQLKDLIQGVKGEVVKVDEWGKRELAYPIKKCTEAVFFLFNLNLPAKAPAELEKKLKSEEEILRCLLVRKE